MVVLTGYLYGTYGTYNMLLGYLYIYVYGTHVENPEHFLQLPWLGMVYTMYGDGLEMVQKCVHGIGWVPQ